MTAKKSQVKVKSNIIHTAGKRKRAVARATLRPGKGIVRFNHMDINVIQPEFARLRLQEPLLIAGDAARQIDIEINTSGGGWAGQLEAARLAVGKALAQYGGEELKKTLLEYDRHLLVADTRSKEPRKAGRHSRARAGRQTSYR
jgi:small subunit ribosomal protein S9